MSTITVRDLMKIIDSINIIDIRSNSAFNNNHIRGAKNIEYSSLLSEPNKYLNRNSKYYIYCQRGMRSYKLCSYLSSLGYNVVNIAGGYESYILEN